MENKNQARPTEMFALDYNFKNRKHINIFYYSHTFILNPHQIFRHSTHLSWDAQYATVSKANVIQKNMPCCLYMIFRFA